MNGLFLHTSNRLETLADALAHLLAEALPASPLEPQTVLVQSQGMQRWVSLQLADRLGVCMNCAFPFPRAFLAQALAGVVPAGEATFSAPELAWQIYDALPRLVGEPAFTPVRRYLADDDPVKRYQLAARLAGLFDQYLAYRPRLLVEWEGRLPAGGDALWQARLWREICAPTAGHFGTALEALARGEATLPPGGPVAIFGIAALPPGQVEVFFHLAATRPVHLFLLSPSSEYHGDDLTPRQRARRGLPPAAPEEAGNPLLTSLGRLHARFVETVLEVDERAGHRLIDTTEAYHEPAGRTLLERVQRDILHARRPLEPEPPQAGDASLGIHLCHSAMREVEVLYDQLLALLEADATLQPRDILVMTPEIEAYAPLIHAVFGAPEDPALRLPYSVADRHARSESRVTDTFLRLLELPDQRATAPEVMTLLESAPFCHRFGWEEAALPRLRQWVEAAGIRWGLDAAHRARMGLPEQPEGTWQYGIERLLLGFALPGENTRLFGGVLPLDDVEGSDAVLAGRLAEAVEALIHTVAELREPRPLGEWPAVLETVLARFFGAGEEAESEAVRALREQFASGGELAHAAEALAGPGEPVPFAAVREYVAGALAESEPGRNRFLAGGITFCALKPMRSIPARVIWLLGMNEGTFPRKARALPFDLMAQRPEPGDRSVRDDDRYLFLETLLSARERLGISAVGRSLRDNEPVPPSIVVSELIDALCPYFASRETAEAHLITEHRLAAFSPVYFEGGERTFSYSQANASAAAALAHPAEAAPFLPEPLPAREETGEPLPAERLARFLCGPAAFFLEHRLGVSLREREETLPEAEPLTPNALQRYTLLTEGVADHLRARPRSRPAAAYSARALLPPGALGEQYHEALHHEAERFETRLRPWLAEPLQPPCPLIAPAGPWRVEGVPGPIHGSRHLLFRAARIKAKDRLRAWVWHLLRCAAGAPGETVLAGADTTLLYPPLGNAEALLTELVALYHRGLCQPIPFFPESSALYAKATLYPSGRAAASPLDRARTLYQPIYTRQDAPPAEGEEPANALCFGIGDPFGAEFETAALAVWKLLLANETPAEGGPR